MRDGRIYSATGDPESTDGEHGIGSDFPVIVWIVVILVVVLSFFSHYFGWKADLAMGKDGIGDYRSFLHFTELSSLAFWALGLVWLCGCVAATITGLRPAKTPNVRTHEVLLVVVGPPLIHMVTGILRSSLF